MKPRLDCLPLSAEDTDIWHLVVDRFYGLSDCSRYVFVGLWTRSLTQGRRDAELMYRIEVCRQYEREHPSRFAEFARLGWVHCMVATVVLGGHPVGFANSNITYFA